MRSACRNLCCTAIGQVTALKKISDFTEYSEEEHVAVKETIAMLSDTIFRIFQETVKNEPNSDFFEIKLEAPHVIDLETLQKTF